MKSKLDPEGLGIVLLAPFLLEFFPDQVTEEELRYFKAAAISIKQTAKTDKQEISLVYACTYMSASVLLVLCG